MPDEIFRDARVAGQYDRAAGIIDGVAERCLDRSVIDFKGRDFHAALVINNSLTNIMDEEHDTVRSSAIVNLTNADVILERLLEVGNHFTGTQWTPHLKRHIAPCHYQPSRQPQIRKANDVIGVQVSEKNPVYILPSNLDLTQALQSAATRVEE